MYNLPEHNLPSREKKNIGMTSILAWGKSRAYHPLFNARITKHPHCGHKWPQWLRSTDRSIADDDITTCNFALKCLKPKLIRVTVLLRYYAITARYFLLSYYVITLLRQGQYFLLLSYYVIMELRQGTSLFFFIGIKATVKASVLSLLRYYGKVLYSSFLLASKLLSKQVFHPFYVVTLLRQSTPLFVLASKLL